VLALPLDRAGRREDRELAPAGHVDHVGQRRPGSSSKGSIPDAAIAFWVLAPVSPILRGGR
jgi:hypothetical protein